MFLLAGISYSLFAYFFIFVCLNNYRIIWYIVLFMCAISAFACHINSYLI